MNSDRHGRWACTTVSAAKTKLRKSAEQDCSIKFLLWLIQRNLRSCVEMTDGDAPGPERDTQGFGPTFSPCFILKPGPV